MTRGIRALLTGGSGMVGRNVLEATGRGGIDWLSPSSRELDLLNPEQTADYLAQHRPDVIVHAAGRVGGIQANIAEPVRFLVENMHMGMNLLLAARRTGIRRLVNLGSSCMYPRGHSEPLREEQILTGELEPTNEGYALAKISVARLGEYIAREDSRFQYKTLVPCNLYGRFDHFDGVRSHLVPAIIRKLHDAKSAGTNEVDIWGDGTARREFMYAGDLADAIHKAVIAFESLPPVMNVGLGHDHTVNEYYQAAARVIGYGGRFVHDLTKPVGMARKLVDVSRQSAWGWRPATSLEDGIRRTYEFFLQESAS